VNHLDTAGLGAALPASDQICAMVREHRLPFHASPNVLDSSVGRSS
jgi:hypothetical protein